MDSTDPHLGSRALFVSKSLDEKVTEGPNDKTELYKSSVGYQFVTGAKITRLSTKRIK